MNEQTNLEQPREGEVILRVEQAVAQFDEFAAKLAEFRKRYDGVTYNMDDPRQNKQARSDRLAIGKVISRLDERHRAVKAPLLDATRAVDGRRKEIKDELLDVQDKIKGQIEAHEQKERDRIQGLLNRVEMIRLLADLSPTAQRRCASYTERGIEGTAAFWQERIDKLEAIELGDDWQEYKADAALAVRETLVRVRHQHEAAVKREAEAAELERLRREEEDRKRAEREEAIRKEAAEAEAKRQEQARREALERAERAEQARKDAEEKAKRDAKAAEERAERKRQEAEERARRAERVRMEREQADREEAERKRQAQEREQAEAIERAKARKAHRAKVAREARDSLVSVCGLTKPQATEIVTAIAHGGVERLEVVW